MLELRPNCELCDKDLPPDSGEAMICTYECTFCADCVASILENVCPNCGGGFEKRPVRPKTEWRAGVSLGRQPASSIRKLTTYSRDDIRSFANAARAIAPADR